MEPEEPLSMDDGNFYSAGEDAVSEFELVDESVEHGQSMGPDHAAMSIVDPARYAKQIRFINKTTAKLLVIGHFQEDTVVMQKFEGAVKGEGGGVALGFDAAIEYIHREIPNSPLVFTLESQLDLENFKLTKDLPDGAQGMWFQWFAVNGDDLHFAGRDYAQKKRNIKFKGLGCAEGKF